ncbi:MAG: hypothetical protein AAFR26_21655 [Cyanobacteria bacterium J06626_4]
MTGSLQRFVAAEGGECENHPTTLREEHETRSGFSFAESIREG